MPRKTKRRGERRTTIAVPLPCGWTEGFLLLINGVCPWCNGVILSVSCNEDDGLTWACAEGCNP